MDKRPSCWGIPLLPDSGSRTQALDLLRFAAIGLVLLRHLFVCPEQVSPWLHAITATLARGGWIGVDLFFVLSGFLISGLMFREHQTYGQISLRRFFVRRALKIYPPFWVFIMFALYVETTHGGSLSMARRWLHSELLFFQNYGTSCRWSYTWSLAVEEHFYVLLPSLLTFMAALWFADERFAATATYSIGRRGQPITWAVPFLWESRWQRSLSFQF